MRLAAFLVVACALRAQTPVILISIDTLRADHLSAFGYRRIATPNIDAYADHGTVFKQIECQVPLTLPSHTSLLTSTYPFQNRIEENAEPVPPGRATLASVLHSQGYRTAAFIGSVFLERQLGLDKGFDVYDSPFNFEAFSPISGEMFFAGVGNQYAVRDRRDGSLVAHAATQWLAANRGQPAFVFVHLFDLHKPYPGSSYDARIQYVDGILGRFRQFLIREGWWDRSLVIVLSDHGEGLGDHGEDSHGYFIYESTIHVPLIVHFPANAPTHPSLIDEPAGLIDVAPTVLDFLHLPAAPSFDGRSLLGSDPHTVVSESVHAHDGFGWAPLRSVRMGRYKYIQAPKPELYDLAKDPRELNNIAAANPSQAAALRARLTELLSRYAPEHPAAPADVSPQTAAALRSLGYIAPGPAVSLGSHEPDPKDKLPEFRLYEQSEALIGEGHLQRAVEILRGIVERDPLNTLARRDLGACYLELHAWARARSCFQNVLQRAPDDYLSRYELGMAEERLGMMKEARADLEAACRIAPEAAQCRAALNALETHR
jgi:choline-sulfatase